MKRINPDTGKPFKAKDKRPVIDKQDGRVFRGYMKRIKKDGYFAEQWTMAIDRSEGIKRINPDTGKTFKIKDKRPNTDKQDGRIFTAYTYDRVLKNGYFVEQWLKADIYSESRKRVSVSAFNLESIMQGKVPDVSLRKNPKTQTFYKKGDKELRNGVASIFWKYTSRIDAKGMLREEWVKEDEIWNRFFKDKLRDLKRNAKRRNFKFDLELKDLLLAFEKTEGKCPVFKTKFLYVQSDREETISIDRIDSKKGYIKGNIVIVSQKANLIKSSAAVDEIGRVYDFYKKLTK